MTFYLKYRPRNLDELDLQDVGESLGKIVKSGSIPHAFLFSGPKGTGKTSAARILAKIINCLAKPDPALQDGGIPCDKCEQCMSITRGNNLDVIEMDAASHRGIDDVRVLRDAVKLAPTSAKKKIYIIDEAHMLTTEASNALLKTLEEPPEHVIFILATTNPEKLIDTIKSRTTLIAFRKAGATEIARSLKRVIESEKIKIKDESVVKIAEAANGAFRDAIKILEQVSIEGESYLDSFQKSDLSLFLEYLVKKDEKSAIKEIEKNVSLGISMESFLKDLLEILHQDILSESNKIPNADLITLFELFDQANRNLADTPIEQLPVEIAVIKWCTKKITNRQHRFAGKLQITNEDQENEKPKKDEPAIVTSPTIPVENISLESVDGSVWQEILKAVRPVNASIEGLLRSSKPIGYDGKTLTLGVFYKFHKERLDDVRHKKILEGVMEKVLNNPTKIICTIIEPPAKVVMQESANEPVLTEAKDADIIKIAEDIFSN